MIYFVTRKVKDKYILQKAAYFHCFGLERLPHMSRFELIISDLDLDLLIISLFHLFIYISENSFTRVNEQLAKWLRINPLLQL